MRLFIILKIFILKILRNKLKIIFNLVLIINQFAIFFMFNNIKHKNIKKIIFIKIIKKIIKKNNT
jgi:hypothetical protein